MDFVDGKSSNDLINNATMSDDEVVASYGPPRSLLSISQVRKTIFIEKTAEKLKKNRAYGLILSHKFVDAYYGSVNCE